MPLTGEEKAIYNKQYYRARRIARDVVRVQQIREATSGIPRMMRPEEVARLTGLAKSGGTDSAVNPAMAGHLLKAMEAAGLTLPKTLAKVAEKLEAKRYHGHGEDVIVADDNDAQLRAADLSVRLFERAGTIPSAAAQGPGGASITLIEVNYHAGPQDVVVSADNTELLAIEAETSEPTLIDS